MEDYIIEFGKFANNNVSIKDLLDTDPGYVLFIIEKSTLPFVVKDLLADYLDEYDSKYGINFPFGKYKNTKIANCKDISYFQWLIQPKEEGKEIYAWLRNKSQQMLEQLENERNQNGPPKGHPAGVNASRGPSKGRSAGVNTQKNRPPLKEFIIMRNGKWKGHKMSDLNIEALEELRDDDNNFVANAAAKQLRLVQTQKSFFTPFVGSSAIGTSAVECPPNLQFH